MDRHHQTILTLLYCNFLIQCYELFKFRIWPAHHHVSSYRKFHLICSTGFLKPGLKPKPGDVFPIFKGDTYPIFSVSQKLDQCSIKQLYTFVKYLPQIKHDKARRQSFSDSFLNWFFCFGDAYTILVMSILFFKKWIKMQNF